MVKVLICGGGNGAHVMAGIAAGQPGVTANVLELHADKAERWTNAMKNSDFSVLCHNPDGTTCTFKNKPAIVTNDPAAAIAGVNIIVFVVPAFSHQQYLTELKPFVKPGMVVVGLPGHAGFEFSVHGLWGDKANHVTLLNFESLPWACRMRAFGKSADVNGIKATLVGASRPGATLPPEDATGMLQKCLGPLPMLQVSGHLLGMTLMGINAYVHPAIMYGRWYKWDGKPFDEPPLFYDDLDQFSADFLSGLSDEGMAIAASVMNQLPSVDLKNANHIYHWYLRSYTGYITDHTNLYTCIRTNKTYKGHRHPTVQTADGKYMPNFKHRYMVEDIPCGLVVMKGIATVVGVPTPHMDKVINWAQCVMGKEYVVDGKVAGKNLGETRAPQKYGLNTLHSILGLD